MIAYFRQFVNSPKQNGNSHSLWFLIANILLILLLIIFNNLQIIPLRAEGFIFFAALILVWALYRPSWVFLFFVGLIPLENINLAPEAFGLSIRPYQLVGALLILAVFFRLVSGKLNFKLIRPRWYDWPVILINIGGILSLLNAPDKILSLKLAAILISFSLLYFLARNFVQNFDDFKKIAPFFLASSFIVVVYGIWQNFRFMHNLPSFEVMPGRPNATFMEPDWLGIYLVLLISFTYVMLYSIFNSHSEEYVEYEVIKAKHLFFSFLCLLLFMSYVLLVIIVTRSAWLGIIAVTFIFLFAILTQLRFNPLDWQWGKTIEMKLIFIPTFIFAVAAVFFLNLTNFQLFNRAKSTSSGLQRITVSCQERINLPDKINAMGELDKYDCRHINLEEINSEKSKGKYVAKIYRPDPNIDIRVKIYEKSWEEIKKHPILGIGWGSISEILGRDNREEKLNSSNIFLEIWLGSGILGLASILFLLAYIILTAIRKYYFSTSLENKAVALFLLVSAFAIIIPNLFNAGIFLGFLWVWLAVAIFLCKISNNYS